MRNFQTEQEGFRAGEFGNEYRVRIASQEVIGCNIALFSKIVGLCPNAENLIEFGANIGSKLRAVCELRPDYVQDVIEINRSATRRRRAWGGA
ncbi:MAG: hypothetical protein ACR2Q3_13355 [Woeseiaceae bacterium]